MYNHANILEQPKLPFLERVRRKILLAFRLTDEPIVKVYHGFGNDTNVTVFGHVFLFSPVPRKHYSKNFLTNTFALLRLFMVKPYRKAFLKMQWNGEWLQTQSEKDGFFKFEWKLSQPLEPGWHKVQVLLSGRNEENVPYASGEGSFY